MTLAFGASAQTAEQIRKFQQLSPEQRQAAMDAAQGTLSDQQKGSGQGPETTPEPGVVAPPAEPQGPSAIEQRYAGRTDAASLEQTGYVRSIRQELKQFGYDLFAGTPTTFAPATDIPVPADYVIGPGDTIDVQLFGKDNQQHSLVVTRDGRVSFPELGAIPVAGMHFSELRADLEKRVAEQMIGVKASISMGALRSIRVFVLGDVTRPGSYTVSALSTMTNALFVSGGVRPIGSLRNVQLKRDGRIVTRLDLYDLLLRGDTTDDARLQPGDVIFVPPIGATAGVAGEVRRPAIYELRGDTSVKQLLDVAGGLLATAVPRLAQVERVGKSGNRTLLDVDLEQTPAAGTPIGDGDVVRIYASQDRMEGVVLLAGHVRRPGGVAWNDRMRLTDLVPGPDQLLPRADLEYVVVRREEQPLAKVRVFSTRLSAAWANPESDANVMLEPRDQVFVFVQPEPFTPEGLIPAGTAPTTTVAGQPPVRKTGATKPRTRAKTTADRKAAAGVPPAPGTTAAEADADGQGMPEDDEDPGVEPVTEEAEMLTRQELLEPVLDELIAQAGGGEPTRIVSVGGIVREPGRYPLEANMRVSDLLRAGGGLGEAAYTLAAEITRHSIVDNQKREVSHIPVDLARVLEGDQVSDLVLQAHDALTIKRLPDWTDQLLVELRGEVRFPGVYPIKRTERLSDLLARAGGLTDRAFAAGSVFTREELRMREQERIDALALQLEADISAAALQRAGEDSKTAESIAMARALLPQLRSTRATGRLVIDLPALLKKGEGSQYDVMLKGGDTLIVPPTPQEVTVVGEVQYPTSHLAERGLDTSDYIQRSGGLTYKADDGRAYVVRANGLVEPAYSGWWIFRGEADVRAGDTIVVPLDVERMRPLPLWAGITQIIYQIAVSVAVLNNIGSL